MPMKREAEKLARLISEAVKDLEEVALALSGGLDSGILAWVLRNKRITAYTAGLPNSKDMVNAKEAAALLGVSLKFIYVDEKGILEGIRFLKEIDGSITPLEIGFELPLYFVAKNSSERIIVTGQGADELFGGYHKYLDSPELMEEDLKRVVERTFPREKRIVEELRKELVAPYLKKEIIEFAQSLPLQFRVAGGRRKIILREAGRLLDVPPPIIEREKKAAQYGSGIWNMIKKMAKREGKRVGEFIESI